MKENEITVKLDLNYAEACALLDALHICFNRRMSASDKRHRIARRTKIEKAYSQQKVLDSLLLAQGAKSSDLSGEAGCLRKAIASMKKHEQFIEERADRLQAIRDKIRLQLPPKE